MRPERFSPEEMDPPSAPSGELFDEGEIEYEANTERTPGTEPGRSGVRAKRSRKQEAEAPASNPAPVTKRSSAGFTITARGSFVEPPEMKSNRIVVRGAQLVSGPLDLPPHAPSILEEDVERMEAMLKAIADIERKQAQTRRSKPRAA